MCGLRIHIQYEYLVPRDDGEKGHLSVITQNSRPWLMGTWFKGRDISALEIYLLFRVGLYWSRYLPVSDILRPENGMLPAQLDFDTKNCYFQNLQFILKHNHGFWGANFTIRVKR